MAIPLSDKTEQHLVAVFEDPGERDQARWILENECGDTLPLWSSKTPTGFERIRFAVLKISGGSMAALADAVRLEQLPATATYEAAGRELTGQRGPPIDCCHSANAALRCSSRSQVVPTSATASSNCASIFGSAPSDTTNAPSESSDQRSRCCCAS